MKNKMLGVNGNKNNYIESDNDIYKQPKIKLQND